MSAVLPLTQPLTQSRPGAAARHRPRLLAPWYARDAAQSGPQLHEYRGADFMQRFEADLSAQRLTATRNQPWTGANRLDGSLYPSLRLPIHDGFYVVCCELACDDRAGSPLDPRRVIAAWAQLHRRGTAPAPGTRGGPAPLQGVAPPPNAAPLRARLAADARGRTHTLLTGYLPVADEPESPAGDAARLQAARQAAGQGLADRIALPAGAADRVPWRPGQLDERLGALIQMLDEHLGIGAVDGALVYTADPGGTPSDPVPIADWRDWLGSAHFYAEPETGPNTLFHDRQSAFGSERNRARANVQPALLPAGTPQATRDALARVATALTQTPVPARTPRTLSFDSRADYTPARIAGLTRGWHAYVAALAPLVRDAAQALSTLAVFGFDPAGLRQALTRLGDALEGLRLAAAGLDAQFADAVRYRRQSLLQWLVADRPQRDSPLADQLPGDRKLIVPGDWSARGGALVRRRVLMLTEGVASQLAEIGDGAHALADDDPLYQVTVFARVRGEGGCEYLVQSAPAGPWRIASFYETRLMPPRPIRMPRLADLKKAVAGAAMILPEDLAAEVSRLRFPDGEVEQSGPSLGGRWIYVFSIPIVTICAMILLMLMINILNFIFRWIPFAILRIPFPR